MAFAPELIAEIKRRNPFATDEQIARLEAEWGRRQGGMPSTGEIMQNAAISSAVSAEAPHAVGVAFGPEAGQGVADVLPMAGNAYQAWDISKNDKMTREQKTAAIQKEAGMAVANFFTGGLAGLGRAILNQTGFGRDLEGKVNKALMTYNKYIPNVFSVAGQLGAWGGLGTKEKQAQRAMELMQKGVTGYADMYAWNKLNDQLYKEKFGDQLSNSWGARKDLDPMFIGIDPASGRFINNAYATTHDIQYLRPEDVAGQQGMFDTFGNDWLGKYKLADRLAIAKELLAAGLMRQDKGDIIINGNDKAAALAIRDKYFGGPQAAPQFGPTEEEKEAARQKEEEAKRLEEERRRQEEHGKIKTTP